MVGRREQLEALERRLAGLAGGRGAAAAVIGEPGIGKSRLVAELRRRAETDGSARWVEGRARSYGRMQADHLLVDLVRATVPIAPADAAADPALASLLGDGTGPAEQRPEGVRAAYVAAVGGLLRACAAEGPLVALLEDLHWSDESSADTIAQLLPAAADSPILLLATTRDEPDVPGWHLLAAMRRAFREFEELRVGPLSEADARTLVSNLLEIEALPASVRDTIVARADGNPFFVEETLRMLIDRGALAFRDGRCVATEEITRVEIPETIHGLLLARIDRLASEPRRALRVASVIGREFEAGLLERVLAAGGEPTETLRDDLDVLAAAGLVHAVRGSAPPLHRFRHALVQEAAYDSLLRAERATLHGIVGRALETITTEPEELDDQAARISEHFEQAGEPARALPWARRAADAAFARYALPEALAQFRRAIALASVVRAPTEGELTELYLRAGRTIELMDRYAEAVALYEEMLEAARERGDRSMELAALAARATGEAMSVALAGEQGATEAHALEALELARELGDRAAEAKLLWVLMLANRFSWGDSTAGVEYGRRSVAISREHGFEEQAALSAQDLAQNLAAHGQLVEAYAMVSESIAYWLRVGNLPLAANGLRNRAEIEWLQGELDAAERTTRQAFEIDERTANVWGRGMSRLLLGGLAAERGRFDDAIGILEEALAIAEASELIVLRLTIGTTLAAVLIAAGQPERARGMAEASRNAISGMFEGIQDIPRAILAAAALAAGRPQEASTLAEPGTAFHPDLPFAYSIATLWSAPIEAAIIVGQVQPARSTADRILEHAVNTGARLWQPEARRLRALGMAAAGDPAAADAELDLALALAREIGMVPTTAAIERSRAAIAATA